jgi:hypothetical protein
VCKGQSETGEADAMFILENGATLSNVSRRVRVDDEEPGWLMTRGG